MSLPKLIFSFPKWNQLHILTLLLTDCDDWREWQEHRLMHRYNNEKGLEMVGVVILKYIANSVYVGGFL